jgi:hypothetical protein
MAINKKQWFDVPNSMTKREDGKGSYYNVDARFSDHPVINIEQSRIARHNVYEFSIVLHTRVKRAMSDARAQPNMSAQAIRFDKGATLGGDAFEAAKLLLVRCWDAWEHYQKFREAPVSASEELALHQIEVQRNRDLAPSKLTVSVGGQLVERDLESGDDYIEDVDDEQPSAPPPPVKLAVLPRKARAKAVA